MKLNGMNKKNKVANQIEEIVKQFNNLKEVGFEGKSEEISKIKINCRKIINELRGLEKTGWVVEESRKIISDIASEVGNIKTSCSKNELSNILAEINNLNNSINMYVDMFIKNEKSICIAKAHTLYKLLVDLNEEKNKLRMKQNMAIVEEGGKSITNGQTYSAKTQYVKDFISRLYNEYNIKIGNSFHYYNVEAYKGNKDRYYYFDLLHLSYEVKNPNMKTAYLIVKELIRARKMQLESYSSGKLEKKLFNK